VETKLNPKDIQSKTSLALSGEWQESELALLGEVLARYQAVGMPVPFPFPVKIALERSGKNCLREGKTICLNTNGLTTWTIAHELAHAWDASAGWQLSSRMRKATLSGFLCEPIHNWRSNWRLFWYRAGSPPPPCGVDQHFNAIEDFAEAVTAYLYPEEAAKRAVERGMPYEKWGYAHFKDTPRGKFMREILLR
jgi:hypothetical protein